jgi:hypothetical protein
LDKIIKIKYFLAFIAVISFVLGDVSFAQDQEITEFPSDSEVNNLYVFHLYLSDKGNLVVDRQFEFPYEVMEGEYFAFPGAYRFEVINKLNEIGFQDSFDHKGGNPKFTFGVVQVNAPYHTDGKEVIFYNEKNEKVLTVNVEESSFCDDDDVCELNYGESYKTCPNDCKDTLLPGAGQTPIPTGINSGKKPSL